MLIAGSLQTLESHSFDKERLKIQEYSLNREIVSLEACIEEDTFAKRIAKNLARVPDIVHNITMSIERTKNKLKEEGNALEYLAFLQALPIIAENLKKAYPMPDLGINNLTTTELTR